MSNVMHLRLDALSREEALRILSRGVVNVNREVFRLRRESELVAQGRYAEALANAVEANR